IVKCIGRHRALGGFEAAVATDPLELLRSGTRDDPPITRGGGTVEVAARLDDERPSLASDRAAHQLVADEPGGPVLVVAHEPFDVTLALDVAAELLIASSARQLASCLQGLIGVLLHRGDAERSACVHGGCIGHDAPPCLE